MASWKIEAVKFVRASKEGKKYEGKKKTASSSILTMFFLFLRGAGAEKGNDVKRWIPRFSSRFSSIRKVRNVQDIFSEEEGPQGIERKNYKLYEPNNQKRARHVSRKME